MTTMLTLPLRRPFHRFVLRPVSVAVALAAGAPASFGLPQGAQATFGQTDVKQAGPTQLNIQQAT